MSFGFPSTLEDMMEKISADKVLFLSEFLKDEHVPINKEETKPTKKQQKVKWAETLFYKDVMQGNQASWAIRLLRPADSDPYRLCTTTSRSGSPPRP